MKGIRSAAVISAAVSLSLTVSAVAHAAPLDEVSRSEDVAALVAEVAPEVAVHDDVNVDAASASVVADTDAGLVTVPLDPTEDVTIGDGELVLGLPEELAESAAEVTDGGDVVFLDEDVAVSGSVTPLDGGVRIATVIESNNAPHEFSYPVEGAELELADDGSILLYRTHDVVRATGEVDQVRLVDGYIEAPWAFDANGRQVDTYYEVADDTFTQIVVPDTATAYPIVADPTAWWGMYWNISSANANRLAAVLTAGSGVAAVVSVLIAAGVVTAPGALATGIGSGVMAIGGGVIAFCNANGRGIVIKKPWVGPMWCESR